MIAKKLYVGALGDTEPQAIFIIDSPQPAPNPDHPNRMSGVHVVAELGVQRDLAERLVAAWNLELERDTEPRQC